MFTVLGVTRTCLTKNTYSTVDIVTSDSLSGVSPSVVSRRVLKTINDVWIPYVEILTSRESSLYNFVHSCVVFKRVH